MEKSTLNQRQSSVTARKPCLMAGAFPGVPASQLLLRTSVSPELYASCKPSANFVTVYRAPLVRKTLGP